jgi:hypothetical protein
MKAFVEPLFGPLFKLKFSIEFPKLGLEKLKLLDSLIFPKIKRKKTHPNENLDIKSVSISQSNNTTNIIRYF